jgi:hypothetical protein
VRSGSAVSAAAVASLQNCVARCQASIFGWKSRYGRGQPGDAGPIAWKRSVLSRQCSILIYRPRDISAAYASLRRPPRCSPRRELRTWVTHRSTTSTNRSDELVVAPDPHNHCGVVVVVANLEKRLIAMSSSQRNSEVIFAAYDNPATFDGIPESIGTSPGQKCC